MRKITDQKIFRVLDANINRVQEGLRVCEDVCRFIYDDPAGARALKACRHEVTAALEALPRRVYIGARDIRGDVGKGSITTEMTRQKVGDVLFANLQRVKEALRVLEEFAKLFSPDTAERLKGIRYRVYGVERRIVTKFSF